MDEVVILKEENILRAKWKLTRVTKLVRNKQGRVSSVVLRLPQNKISGNGIKGKIKYLKRPIEHIYALEVENDSGVEPGNNVRCETDPNLDREEPELVASCVKDQTAKLDEEGKGSDSRIKEIDKTKVKWSSIGIKGDL